MRSRGFNRRTVAYQWDENMFEVWIGGGSIWLEPDNGVTEGDKPDK